MSRRRRELQRKKRIKLKNQAAFAASQSSSPKPWAAQILMWGPCVVAFLIYLGSLRFGFIHDDHSQIVSNPQIRSWAYLDRLVTSDVWSQRGAEHIGYYYRPLFSVWLLVIHTFGGLSPWFWHLSSDVLHTFATWAVFELTLELLENSIAASFSALLFAVHPIHIESVCWISASNEILYSVFVLLSLFLYARKFRQDPQVTSSNWMAVGLWSAALFSKETAIAVLPIFFFLAYRVQDNSLNWRARLRGIAQRTAPFCLVAAVYLAVRWLVLHKAIPEGGEHTWAQILWSAPSMLAFYFQKLVWPVRLSAFYMNQVLSAPSERMWLTFAVILIGSGVTAWFAVKRSTVAGLSYGLLILPLGPVLLAMRLFRQGNLSHDRYLYLPSVGVCLLGGMFVRYMWSGPGSRKIVVAVSGAILLASVTWLNLIQQWFYRNDETLYGQATELFPNNVYAIDELGFFYLGQKQFDRSLEQLSRAHDLAPDDENATFDLTKGLIVSEKYKDAEPYLEQLSNDSHLQPSRRAVVLLALGQTEIKLGQLSRAEDVLIELKKEHDSYPGLHDTLGALYQVEGRIPEALSEYTREFQISGNPRAQQKALGLAQLQRPNARSKSIK